MPDEIQSPEIKGGTDEQFRQLKEAFDRLNLQLKVISDPHYYRVRGHCYQYPRTR